jgi:REP element-mobilizing transposase RayT
MELHHHVIMPDHMHAIIQIEPHGHSMKIKSLSELMGAFKTRSSKFIRLAGMEHFTWQRSFHDRIARNTHELNRIANYIIANPERYTL